MVLICSVCLQTKRGKDFTKSQLRKINNRKCKQCMGNQKYTYKWTICAQCNEIDINGANVIRLTENTFITHNLKSGYVYHERQNCWQKLFDLPWPYLNKHNNTMAIDYDNKEIYIFTVFTQGIIYHIKLNEDWNAEINTIHLKGHFDEVPNNQTTLSVFIDNKLHLISSVGKSRHFIWNKTQKTMQCIYEFDEGGWEYGELIYVKSKKILLLICLYKQQILYYSFKGYKWIGIPWTFNRNRKTTYLYDFGWILTENERFVIMFGGNIYKIGQSKAIYVYDIEQKQLKRIKSSKWHCLRNGGYKAALTSNRGWIKMLIFGYFNRCWNDEDNDILDIPILPNEIMNIIGNMYGRGIFAHLLSNDKNHTHYKTNIGAFLKQLNSIQSM